MLFLIIFLNPIAVLAADVWLIVENISPEELQLVETPQLDSLQKKGAFGLINLRTAAGYQLESIYLSAGSAGRARAFASSATASNVEQGIINPAAAELINLNKTVSYQPQIGYLGNLLQNNNITAAILGNSDHSQEKISFASLFLMNDRGEIPLGDVSRKLLRENNLPWQYETDWILMQEKFSDYQQRADIIIVESGDLARVKNYQNYLNNEQKNHYKMEYLARIDIFLAFLVEQLDLEKNNIGIMMLNPVDGYRLGWLLVAGDGIESGWISSKATRRKGIITINNLAPAVASLQGISTSEKGISIIKESNLSWLQLHNSLEKITVIDHFRPHLIKMFIVFQLIVIILAFLKMPVYKKPLTVIITIVTEYSLLTLFLLPVNFLFISLFTFHHIPYYLLILVLITFFQVYLLKKMLSDRLLRIITVSTFTVLILIIDLIFNSRLMADSLLGFSSVIGARYYGIGNEYMGIFVGAWLISISGLSEILPEKRRYLKDLFMISGVFIIGAPFLGANFGGTLTMVSGVLITLYYQKKACLHIKPIFLGIISVIVVMAVLLFFDFLQLMAPSTHIGDAFGLLLEGDLETLYLTVQRKLAMNLKLLRWTIWTRILLAFLIFLLIFLTNPGGKIGQVMKKYPLLAAGLNGGVFASIIAMLANDSGVVAAATLLFFPVFTILYLIPAGDEK